MNEFTSKDIDEEKIIQILNNLDFNTENAEFLSTSVEDFPHVDIPPKFVVQNGNDIYLVEIFDEPLNEELLEVIYRHEIGFYLKNRDKMLYLVIISSVEEEKDVRANFGSITIIFKLHYLKNII